ncbi:hypothetical protein [Pollutibacter soli]|uniref:hypothetical protein n=1 Tax=Pollutibacter soli TaxID=3034157 RepID=UPI0030140832
MKLEYNHLLPSDFSADSRVWIYQSNRLFTMAQALQIEEMINAFVSSWNTHGTPVKGFGTLFFGRFVVLIADETQAGVSGCSTDSSVRVIKEIEKLFQVSMFDRNLLAFFVKDNIQLIPLSQFNYAFEHGIIGKDTVYFNNIVPTLGEMKSNWLIPVGSSWLNKRFHSLKSV